MIKGSLQEKNGKYYVVFRLNGKQKWVSTKIDVKRGNKRKAESVMAEIISKVNENPSCFEKILFTDYIKNWLNYTKTMVDDVTYDGYVRGVQNHLIPYFDSMKKALQDITVRDIESYYVYKSKDGRADGKTGGLSVRTIRLHGTILSLIFKQAIKDGLIKENICAFANYPKSEKNIRETSFYTIEQCNDLLSVTKGMPLHNMIYITMLYGLRRSELMGLRWSAIDFNNNTICINHTVVLGKKIIAKDSTKNKSSNRVYPLFEDVKNIFKNLLTEQNKNKALLGNSYCESGYVFTKADGSLYYPSYPTHELRKILKKNDLPYIRWHDLRHSCASMLIMKGWHMKDISEWLGHSNIGTTMNVYGHISIEHKRELANGLNGLLNN